MKLDAPVSTIMTAQVDSVTPAQKLVDIKHLYEKTPFHHHIPVVENNKVTGMVSLVDFMRAIGTASLNDNDSVYQNLTVKDIMSISPVTMKPDTSIKKAAKEMVKGEVHAFIIADHGELKGILSYTDIINYLLRVLD
ncbi:MAG: CBS domain-containing protein [Crocinitomicaceae bacterium]|nr:CBS domain-containing protein [Crocinitomicaceae bacterium]MBK9591251.1 CBS domain-containing protein [Crocinitomicaceae bacterium]